MGCPAPCLSHPVRPPRQTYLYLALSVVADGRSVGRHVEYGGHHVRGDVGALPGSDDIWPLKVRANGEVAVVVTREGLPAVQLSAGRHQLAGEFAWAEMPQRIAMPRQVGFLSLTVEGNSVPIPNWDADGHVWLKRQRAEVADKNQLAVQVYRVVEDGIPMWLRTEIELTVSGQSREEDLGWILPQDWKMSLVDSPIPVAVDERGRMKAQVRAGKWTIRVDAFRTTDLRNSATVRRPCRLSIES